MARKESVIMNLTDTVMGAGIAIAATTDSGTSEAGIGDGIVTTTGDGIATTAGVGIETTEGDIVMAGRGKELKGFYRIFGIGDRDVADRVIKREQGT